MAQTFTFATNLVLSGGEQFVPNINGVGVPGGFSVLSTNWDMAALLSTDQISVMVQFSFDGTTWRNYAGATMNGGSYILPNGTSTSINHLVFRIPQAGSTSWPGYPQKARLHITSAPAAKVVSISGTAS